MRPDLFPVETPFPGRFAIGPRPRGGDWLDDEMRMWHQFGVDRVVSLLMPDEVAEFDLGGSRCDEAERREQKRRDADHPADR